MGFGPVLDRISSSWLRAKSQCTVKSLPVNINTKHKVKAQPKHRSRRVFWALGSISFFFFGMHHWKNSWGWHNKYNKYRFQNNIYCCRKLLSALRFSPSVSVRLCGPKGLVAKRPPAEAPAKVTATCQSSTPTDRWLHTLTWTLCCASEKVC